MQKIGLTALLKAMVDNGASDLHLTVGVPPEFIGTGRALQQIENKNIVEKYYVSFRNEMKRAGRYINKENLSALAKEHKSWKLIAEDIKALEQYLGEEFKPETEEEKKHQELTSQIYSELKHHSVSPILVEEAGKLRHSLG